MNALDLIENDFKILSNELKKRNGNIKDVSILHYHNISMIPIASIVSG